MDLRSYDELNQTLLNDQANLKEKLKEKKNKDIQECKDRLGQLPNPTDQSPQSTSSKIQECLDMLIEMQKLIVVFDGIRCLDNLEDAIADAMWNEISYERENETKVSDGYDPRAEELKWCMVIVSLSFLSERNPKVFHHYYRLGKRNRMENWRS